ncbi:MAG: hypothetical protein AABY22_20660 [Nanoarchaeota archaeon]
MSSERFFECGCPLHEDYKCDFCNKNTAVKSKVINKDGLWGHFCSDECATNAILILHFNIEDKE